MIEIDYTEEKKVSVVHIIPEQYQKAINAFAEAFGCGENNLSCELLDANGGVFFGGHSWWRASDYAIFMNIDVRNQVIAKTNIANIEDALDQLHGRVLFDGNHTENWAAALSELGLTEKTSEGE